MTDNNSEEQHLLLYAAALLFTVNVLYKRIQPTPIHNSTGRGIYFVNSLINGHNPNSFHNIFRMSPECFLQLEERCQPHISDGWSISAREKIAIGLHWMAQGSTIRHQCEIFERSLDAISKSRKSFLDAVVKVWRHTFHPTRWAWSNATATSIPQGDTQYRHFSGAIGAVDGSHFAIQIPATESDRYRNRKGFTSTNVMVVCDYNTRITFVHTGVEGCAHDGYVLRDSKFMQHYLDTLPEGVYILGDAGYPLVANRLLVPYRGVRYHLSEYSSENPPLTAQELFNLRHARLRQVVERTIGLIKRRWRVFRIVSEVSIYTFNLSVLAACFLHNFLLEMNDVIIEEDFIDDMDDNVGNGDTGFEDVEDPGMDEKEWRDGLAAEMWADYSL